MQFANYEWYTEAFGGESINEAEFNALARKASAKVNHYCFGRISKMTDDEIPDAVKDCVCELAEILKKQESAGVPTGIKSETNDGYSVSYSENVKIENENELYVGAIPYLVPTGLMFRGVLKDD